MKKIFTFLFFAGLMTSAMAQRNSNGQNGGNQSRDNRNQPTVYSDNTNRPGTGYQQNDGNRQNEEAYNRNQSNGYGNDRRNDNRYNQRNDDRRFRDNNRFNQYAYGYDRRRDYERYNYGRSNARIVIRFGKPACF